MNRLSAVIASMAYVDTVIAATAPGPRRCAVEVYWHDLDMTARCVMSAGHPGPAHRDGIRWFDSHGLQLPSSPQRQRTPNKGRPAGARRAS